jgi:hypothetical protein
MVREVFQQWIPARPMLYESHISKKAADRINITIFCLNNKKQSFSFK